MAASKSDIRGWFDDGVAQHASHMIVVCDTFDHTDFPIFTAEENFWEAHDSHNGPNMTRVMEVYDLALDREAQIAESRAWHYPPRPS
jgi:hypothetical protein